MLVRPEYSDEAVWRKALGNREPLYPFAIHGFSLDASEWIPAGSTRKYTVGNRSFSQQTTTQRQ